MPRRESAMLAAFTAKMPESRPEGAFTALETSTYTNLVIGLCVVFCFETPIVHWIIHRATPPGMSLLWIHAIVLILNVTTILWLIGDLRLMRASHHELARDALHIHLGNRFSGEVLRKDIAEVSVGEVRGLPEDALKITPLDTPNLTLRLRKTTALTGLLGLPVKGDTLLLYVDDPAGLADALKTPVKPKKSKRR